MSESANIKTAQSHTKAAAMYAHPIGVTRITSVRLILPKTYQPIAALAYLQNAGVVGLDSGEQWMVELNLPTTRGEVRRKTCDRICRC